MKKTIAITEECNQLLKELAEKNDTTESKIVKWAIEEYAARNKPEHPDEIVEDRQDTGTEFSPAEYAQLIH